MSCIQSKRNIEPPMTIIRIVWTFINVSYCVLESWLILNKNNWLRIKTKLLTSDDFILVVCMTIFHANYSCCPFCVERMLSLLCATVVPFVCRFSRLFWVYTPISVGADAYRCIVRYQHPKEPSNRAKEPYNKWKEPDNACVILSIDVLSGSFHLL